MRELEIVLWFCMIVELIVVWWLERQNDQLKAENMRLQKENRGLRTVLELAKLADAKRREGEEKK